MRMGMGTCLFHCHDHSPSVNGELKTKQNQPKNKLTQILKN